MLAYIYQASLHCDDCANDIKLKVQNNRLHPDGTEQQDSDRYPQGPHDDGGGEADTPQHCDSCGCFLENSLTDDGRDYIRAALIDYARDGEGNEEVLSKWAEFYGYDIYKKGEGTLEELQLEYSMELDDYYTAVEWWFKIAGELYDRGAPIPEDWKYNPGALGKGVDPDDMDAVLLASAPTSVLMEFMETIKADCERLKEEDDE